MENPRPLLCLGEAIVDLIAVDATAADGVPERLEPFAGGALANVAVAAARAGAPAALVGGVGDDRWGGWLLDGLAAAGVSTEWAVRVAGADTPLAVVVFDSEGEPAFQLYGEHIATTMAACEASIASAVDAGGALVVGSNTMVGPTEREVTRRAVALARQAGLPVLFDPNFRPNRWDDLELARGYCLELAGLSTVTKLNRTEARLMTGEDDLRRAARRIAGDADRLAVVTDGAGEMFAAGAAEAAFRPEPAPVVSPLGAGDAFMGALAAGLARGGWDLTRVAEVLPEASAAAASACSHLGAQG